MCEFDHQFDETIPAGKGREQEVKRRNRRSKFTCYCIEITLLLILYVIVGLPLFVLLSSQ